jgi:hypothetical protein
MPTPTKKQFKDIFADSANYANDVKLTIGDVEVTLGDIRSLSTGEQTKLAEQAAAIAKEKQTVEQAQMNVATTFSKLVESGLVEVDAQGNWKPVAAPAPSTTTPSDKKGTVDYDKDTYVGPLFKQLQKQQEALTAAVSQIKALQGDLNGRWNVYDVDRLSRDFSAHEWPTGMDLKTAIEQARAKKLTDAYGRLDLSKLHEEVARPIRFSQTELDARIDAETNKRVQAQLAAMTRRPGLRSTPAAKPAFKNLDEAMAAAEADPEIQQQLSQIVPGVV